MIGLLLLTGMWLYSGEAQSSIPFGPVFKALPPMPSPPQRSWVTFEDYPAESIRAGESGTVGIRIDIMEDGRAENCMVTKSSGYLRLDEKSCELILLRARFEPVATTARTGAKRPWTTTFTWRLPDR